MNYNFPVRFHWLSMERAYSNGRSPGEHSDAMGYAYLMLQLHELNPGESKRLVNESPWSHFTSECQRF